MVLLERCFHLREHGTSVTKEAMAGFTTFLTVAYLIIANPEVLSQSGLDYQATVITTCIVAVIGTLLVSFLSNLPYVMAPSMGLNTLFTYTFCKSMGYTWQQTLVIGFFAGILLIITSLTGFRTLLERAIPSNLKPAIPVGIGLFIAMTGLLNSGFIVPDQNNGLQLGNFLAPTVLLMIVGLCIVIVLTLWNCKTAFLIGIVLTTILALFFGEASLPESVVAMPTAVGNSFLQMDFLGVFSGIDGLGDAFKLVLAVFSVFLITYFDDVGLMTSSIDEEHALCGERVHQRSKGVFLANGITGCVSSIFGNSSPAILAESNSGIAQGGRTGLTGVFAALGFCVAIFFSPVFQIIPSCATAPVLVIVGVLMARNLKEIHFEEMDEAIPAFFIAFGMPLTYSITNGIALGFISYCFCKAVKGKFREIHPIMLAVSILFLLQFIFM